MLQETHQTLLLMCSTKYLLQKVSQDLVTKKERLLSLHYVCSRNKTLMSSFLWLKTLKVRLESLTKTKGMTCFLPLRQWNQQRITKETMVSRNKDNLRRPPDRQRHQQLRFHCQASPHRTWETACYRTPHWAFKSSTPPTSCWRRFHAPWSFCPSPCSSWQRLSRSLCANPCSSSGRRCRFSETSLAAPLHSCTINWMDGQRYSNEVSDTYIVKLYHWLHTWPSGAGTSSSFGLHRWLLYFLIALNRFFCGSILKLYS